MKYLRNIYWLIRGFKRDRLTRKPYVVIRRSVDERWTSSDREWVNWVITNPVWEKLMRFADDSLCQDVMGDGREIDDVDWIRAMTAGRMRERNFIATHAGLPGRSTSVDPARDEYFEDEEAQVDDDDERSDIQVEDKGEPA